MTDIGTRSLPPDTSPLLRLNRICPYYTMFPLRFPFSCLAGATQDQWLIDPFCGRGTSNFAARLRGMRSVGIDGNPVAAAIAQAKLTHVRASDLTRTARNLIDSKDDADDVPSGEFWDLCYHPETLRGICKLRESLLRDCGSQSRIALRALVLGILHGPLSKGDPTYLSNQMPRTYATKPRPAIRYWRRRRMKPPKVDVLSAITRRARFSFAEVPAATDGEVILGDSREVKLGRRRFQWVVTSPPYYGMRSYIPDQWLRNWFLGGPADVEYSVQRQLAHRSEDEFVEGMAEVWGNVAKSCLPGARLIVRFGALPSRAIEPRQLLARSLADARCGWRVVTVRRAGTATKGRRQYDQFGPSASIPVEEVDLYARLEA